MTPEPLTLDASESGPVPLDEPCPDEQRGAVAVMSPELQRAIARAFGLPDAPLLPAGVAARRRS